MSGISDPAILEVCVARQPIFDARMRVTAYELLYRHRRDDQWAEVADGAVATARVIAAAVGEIGLATLRGSSTIHVNLPRELIVNPVDLPLSPASTIIEVLETAGSDPLVLAGIDILRQRGYRIALDDYVSADHVEALVEVADIVKLDLAHEPRKLWPRTIASLLRRGVCVIAEKVETLEQFEQCVALGVHGFQGYFLERPETFFARRVPSIRLVPLQILAALQDPAVTPDALEKLISQDLGMVNRLLRSINSAHYSLPRKVASVQQAVVMIGLTDLRRLCAVLVLAAFDDRPAHLLFNALVRARMCGLLASSAHGADEDKLFFTGLLSHLDALLGMSTLNVVSSLPLDTEVVSALTARTGPMGEVLRTVLAYERGDWETALHSSADSGQLRRAYVDAVMWAEKSWVLLNA